MFKYSIIIISFVILVITGCTPSRNFTYKYSYSKDERQTADYYEKQTKFNNSTPENHYGDKPDTQIVKNEIKKKTVYSTPIQNSSDIYTIRKGDSLYSISRKFNISINDLIKINKINNRNKIYPGMTLKLK